MLILHVCLRPSTDNNQQRSVHTLYYLLPQLPALSINIPFQSSSSTSSSAQLNEPFALFSSSLPPILWSSNNNSPQQYVNLCKYEIMCTRNLFKRALHTNDNLLAESPRRRNRRPLLFETIFHHQITAKRYATRRSPTRETVTVHTEQLTMK